MSVLPQTDLVNAPDSIGTEVLFDVGDHIATVCLNRPDKRNAINGAVTQGLDWVVKRVESDRDIRVAILASTSLNAFSAGADLNAVSAGEGASLMSADGGFAGFVAAPKTKPWIAAVPATAYGGGFELALACDMIVAAREASFGLPEVKRGLFAAAGGVFLLPRYLPRNLALEIIATGDPIGAARAAELGVVNRVVDDAGNVLSEATTLAKAIAENAPLSVRESLIVARRAFDAQTEELWTDSHERSLKVMMSKDAREGATAFLEKRKPNWSGE